MALYFFILLTVLKLGESLPDPNVKVGVDLRIDDEGNNCCGGGGGVKRSCMFGGMVWANEAYLTEACFELQCKDGTWEYKDTFDKKCGNCTFGGEPLIYTFDTLNNSKPIITNNNLTGEYIMTQLGLAKPAEFGVHGHFTDTPDPGTCDESTDCINGVTYYEAGVTITITLTNDDADNKILKVFVDGKPFTVGSMVEYVYGTGGAMLVFKHENINGGGEKCIGVIGTKGLTVALCEQSESDYWPWAYIYAMPALESLQSSHARHYESKPSTLYGLCNTWTGENKDCFTLHNGTCTEDWHCGTGWDDINGFKLVPRLCDDVAESWKTNMSSVESTKNSRLL